MYHFLSLLLTPPTFESQEENRIAKQLFATVLLGLFVAPFLSTLVFLFTDDFYGVVLSMTMFVVLLILFGLLKRRKLRLVSTILIVSAYLTVIALITMQDGIRDKGVSIFQVLLILSATFLGGQATVRLGILTLLMILILFAAEWVGWLETPNFNHPPSPGSLFMVLLSVGLTTTMLRLTVDQIVQNARLLEEQATLLQKKNAQLEKTRSKLQERTVQLSYALEELEAKNVALERYQEDLEEVVKQRTQALSQTITDLESTQKQLLVAKEAAEVANQAKSEFLSNMSHELRTPLNGILGYAQILKRSNLTSTDKNGLDIIHQSGHHLLTLINDILDLSKIEARKMELYPEDLHLPSFLDGIVGLMRMRAEEKDVLFVYEADRALPVGVRADEKRLRQVLINLLGNAVKFTQRGRVTLHVGIVPEPLSFVAPPQADHADHVALATSPPLTPPNTRGGTEGVASIEGIEAQFKVPPLVLGGVRGGLVPKADHVTLRFEIIDTGVGMTPEQLKKIFLPFEQVGDAKQRAKGTGLGLAITRQLVSLMGSEVKVVSQLGKGSTFCFDLTLPVVATEVQEQTSINGRIMGYQGAKRTILVVDDKEENRLVLLNMLSPLGFEIILAENGQQEVDLARQITPDLILTDLMMPVMNGFEAVKEIRTFAADMPIIAISASVFDMDQKNSRMAGCDAFLPKPVEEQKLLALISTHLGLEWTYQEQNQELTADAAADSTSPLIAPPAAELQIIYELASLGKISAIRKQLTHIEQLDSQYAPFAHKIRELARGFEDDKIAALVEDYMQQN